MSAVVMDVALRWTSSQFRLDRGHVSGNLDTCAWASFTRGVLGSTDDASPAWGFGIFLSWGIIPKSDASEGIKKASHLADILLAEKSLPKGLHRSCAICP